MIPKLLKRAKSGINTSIEDSNKMRFEYYESSQGFFAVYIRAIQGHTGENMIAPELMGHVAIPYNWKEFIFHRVCSYNANSFLDTGLVAGGKESRGRETKNLLHNTQPLLEKIQMKKNPAMIFQYQERCTTTAIGSTTKSVVYWVKLSCAQEQRLRFWQTKSNAIIAHNHVPAG